MNAWLYWWSFLCRMIFILAPVLFALFDVQLVECGFWELILFWLPAHLLSRRAMEYLSTNIRSARWSQIIDTILGALPGVSGAGGNRWGSMRKDFW